MKYFISAMALDGSKCVAFLSCNAKTVWGARCAASRLLDPGELHLCVAVENKMYGGYIVNSLLLKNPHRWETVFIPVRPDEVKP